jgi:hypothetical protein
MLGFTTDVHQKNPRRRIGVIPKSGANFPLKRASCLHLVDDEPIFEDIQVTTLLPNRNVISVPSVSGGGADGHIGIIMT